DAASEYPVYVANAENTTLSQGVCNAIIIQAGRKTNDGANSRYMVFKRPDDNTIGRIIQSSGDNVSYSTTSDERLKTNITASALGLDDLMQINIFDYNYIGENPAKRRQGYLAQQLHQIYPQAVEKGGADVKQFAWMVDYGAITPLLVKSLQDQEPIIQEQAALIQEQEGLIEQLETQVEALHALKALVQQLEAQTHSSISNSSN
ncbi:MAG: tail fiber domain-containing protein, partial [Phaeodactylibacter sp.]|nr:tail fiber domain-containing protein [Phaeodactylibacter sp.]